MLQLKKGIRLESLRQPFKKALQSAAEMGANGIEINARTEVRPAELTRTGVRQIKKMLSDNRLEVCCINFTTRRSYADPNDLDERIDATKAAMSMAYDLGCRVVSNRLASLPGDSSPADSTFVQALEDIGRHSHRVGCSLALRSGPIDGFKLGDLIHRLSPAALSVDFDPAELLISGQDVEACMKALAPHVVHFRARDAVIDLSKNQGLEVQLGRGSVDLAPLLALLEENAYQGFITLDRQAESDPVFECAQSMQFLDNLFA